MNDYLKKPLAVRIAEETLDLWDEVYALRREVAELRMYRDKYTQSLQDGIAHSGHMLAGMFELAMKPGVLEAVAKANETECPN